MRSWRGPGARALDCVTAGPSCTLAPVASCPVALFHPNSFCTLCANTPSPLLLCLAADGDKKSSILQLRYKIDPAGLTGADFVEALAQKASGRDASLPPLSRALSRALCRICNMAVRQ